MIMTSGMHSKNNPQPVTGAREPGASLPVKTRDWALYVIVAIALPCALVFGAELILRLFHVGYDPRYFGREKSRGSIYCVDNPAFARRFFPTALVRPLDKLRFPLRKGDNARRIFVLGSVDSQRQGRFDAALNLLVKAAALDSTNGEYKLMGLAPFGDGASQEKESFKKTILDKLVDIRDDGSLLLNMENFEFATGLRMVNDKKWENLFGIPRRTAEAEISRSYMNLALAIQEITEEVVQRLAATAKTLTNCEALTMAGGVALNCKEEFRKPVPTDYASQDLYTRLYDRSLLPAITHVDFSANNHGKK